MDTLASFTFTLHLAVVHLLVWSGVHCATAVGYGFRAAIACLEEACMMAATHTWCMMAAIHSLASLRVLCMGFTLCSVCALLISSRLCVPCALCVGFAYISSRLCVPCALCVGFA